jgi:hypothetical protein
VAEEEDLVERRGGSGRNTVVGFKWSGRPDLHGMVGPPMSLTAVTAVVVKEKEKKNRKGKQHET